MTGPVAGPVPGPARILVVDDEAPIRRFLRIALKAEGHEVVEAATAREGVRAAGPATSMIAVADLRIDAAARTVAKAGVPVRLTRREFDLLWMLASQAGRLVTQGMILRALWGPAHADDSQYLRVYVRQLRAKPGDDAADPRYLFTEPGVGYRFREP